MVDFQRGERVTVLLQLHRTHIGKNGKTWEKAPFEGEGIFLELKPSGEEALVEVKTKAAGAIRKVVPLSRIKRMAISDV